MASAVHETNTPCPSVCISTNKEFVCTKGKGACQRLWIRHTLHAAVVFRHTTMLTFFIFLVILRRMGKKKSFSSPHFHVFSYAWCNADVFWIYAIFILFSVGSQEFWPPSWPRCCTRRARSGAMLAFSPSMVLGAIASGQSVAYLYQNVCAAWCVITLACTGVLNPFLRFTPL